MLVWAQIDTVLLDMDGTLLDLHFDNHFWLDHLPRRYAEKLGMAPEIAAAELRERYRRVQGTLDWYCVDYWTRELGLDIAQLKQEVEHLIALRPHALEFLAGARAQGKRLLLVTNAHRKALEIKLRRTRLEQYLDAVVCAHDLGLPKERAEFWERLHAAHAFERSATLFIDDSLPVLRAARAFGVAQLRAVRQPDSRLPDKDVGEFEALASFRDIMPK